MNRRNFLCTGALSALSLTSPLLYSQSDIGADVLQLPATAEQLRPLKALAIAYRGRRIIERGFHGHSATAAANIKSASKSIMSALCGIAIDRGVLSGPEQKIATILEDQLPADPDPRLQQITVGHLLTMQAGLGSTSGPNYGAWVLSKNWVQTALAQPFIDQPGGRMIYSTGSSHLLSAVLTKASGRSALALARDWFAPLNDFAISAWDRDPQGIYFGGNQMAMSARSLLAFGELYRRRGLGSNGQRILSESWIEASWQPRTQSFWTGDDYGYGWFLRDIAGHAVRFGWGFGGQMIYVVPSLELSVAMVSNATRPSARSGYRNDLHNLLAEIIFRIEKVQAKEATLTGV